MFLDRLELTVKQAMAQRDKDRAVFLRSFLNLVLKYDYIVLFHHVRPDGDSLGSVFGFQEIIRSNFPHKKVYVVGESSGMYSWMPMRFDNFLNYSFDFANSIAVVFDVGQSSRIQRFNRFFQNSHIRFGSVVRIDHHGISSDFHVDLTWDDPTYASTCCQIMQIADFYG